LEQFRYFALPIGRKWTLQDLRFENTAVFQGDGRHRDWTSRVFVSEEKALHRGIFDAFVPAELMRHEIGGGIPIPNLGRNEFRIPVFHIRNNISDMELPLFPVEDRYCHDKYPAS
jgi:hypothetical protein